MISLLGLFLMGLPYLYGAALAAIVAVLVVMAASVTLLPALLAFAGTRIDRLRIPGTQPRRRRSRAAPAARWGRAVQRRPWVAAIAGVAVLLVLASPFAGPAARLPRPGQRRRRHDHAPGLRPRLPGLRARRERAAAARRADRRTARREAMAALAGALRRDPGVAAVARTGRQPRAATPSCSP